MPSSSLAGLFLLAGVLFPPNAVAATYYVDCAGGNDSAGGLTTDSAWRSVARASKQDFEAGDSILLRRGTTCSGSLTPKGSGKPGAPISLSAWGVGPLPKVQAGPGHEAALKLFNQEYWRVENIEFIGGEPHGVFVTGDKGVLRSIHLSNLVVRDVTGKPKNKAQGLVVVAPGSPEQRFDDVVIDGVTAYRTSEWAGILIGGSSLGFLPEAARSTNVVVRNSIVYDVQGDGIILFQVNNGRIENSVAWRTGMQETEYMGTPNAIWTWMCRGCTIRRNEAFLVDTPGIDGGAFDIDYGSEDTVVAENYGHDTQGYCLAVFGAAGVTTNSLVTDNVCADNGLSPRLARRQGAIFLSTWDEGKLNGVRIERNRVYWSPPIDAAALVNRAEFIGRGSFEGNTIRSSSPALVDSNASLTLDRNTYEYAGPAILRWLYNSKSWAGFAAYVQGSGQDVQSRLILPAPMAVRSPPQSRRLPASLERLKGKWLLAAFVAAHDQTGESRGQVTLLQSAQLQFKAAGLTTVLVMPAPSDRDAAINLKYDWNLRGIELQFDEIHKPARIPTVMLIAPDGRLAWEHEGPAPPGELGLALRALLGTPIYAQMSDLPQ